MQSLLAEAASPFAAPRIIFSGLGRSRGVEARRWLSLGQELFGTPGEDDWFMEHTARGGKESRDSVSWRMVSANNREIARSLIVFAGFEEAIADARSGLQPGAVSASSLEVHYSRHAVTGRLAWFACRGGSPYMSSARWYVNERGRAKGIALALAGLSTAVVIPALRPSR